VEHMSDKSQRATERRTGNQTNRDPPSFRSFDNSIQSLIRLDRFGWKSMARCGECEERIDIRELYIHRGELSLVG
jgi:hypothetical protein